jgi:peptidyl-tRNA hydrolase, PTH1 family
MFLIAGLGNPGEQYEWTRHNCGFMVIDRLAQRAGRKVKRRECQALTLHLSIGQAEVLLAKPQTFMNLSGVAVAGLVTRYSLRPSDVFAVTDDLALPFGKLRIRRSGSAGGHNGLKSMIGVLGTQDFPRLRLGIQLEHLRGHAPGQGAGQGPDPEISDSAAFVLAEFPRRDREDLNEMIDRAADAIEDCLSLGIAEAMTRHN